MTGEIRAMERGDIGGVCTLTESEDWGFDESDFSRILDLFPGGSFVAEDGGEIIGVVTTSSYAKTGWVGTVLVDAGHRNRGIGKFLVERGISHIEDGGLRSILLYSYSGLEDFYGSLGFKSLDRYVAYRGIIRATSRRTRAEILEAEDMPDVLRLDRYSFGDDRSGLLTRMRSEFPEACHVLKSQEEIVGYSMSQISDRLTNVGPVICIGPRCEALLLEAVGLLLEGREVFLATKKGKNETLMKQIGLEPSFEVTRMVKGQEPEGNPDTVLAICGLEKG
jgi:predicted N-acetyltransferase YhbS